MMLMLVTTDKTLGYDITKFNQNVLTFVKIILSVGMTMIGLIYLSEIESKVDRVMMLLWLPLIIVVDAVFLDQIKEKMSKNKSNYKSCFEAMNENFG